MLAWALIFFAIAAISGVFGFGGVASASPMIAQILCVIFLALFAIALAVRIVSGRPRGG